MGRQLFILLILGLSGTGMVNAQGTYNSIRQVPDYQKDRLFNLYFKTVSLPNELINGKEYLNYYLHSKTTPLLFSGEILNSTLKVRNREYRNIRLQYDTYLDELIYTDTTRMVGNIYPRIALNKDIVDGFGLVIRGDSMNFRYLKFQQNPANIMKDGFYEIVYDGYSRFIIKHKSKIYNHDALNEYKYSPEGYVMTGGSYNKINSNKTFLEMCGVLSPEMKEFLKRSRIKIRKADKEQIIKALFYLDGLTKSKAGIQ